MEKIKIAFVVLFACLIPISVYSQVNNQEWEELHAKLLKQKYEFLQKELALEDDLMNKFWDVYLQYDNDLSQTHDHAWKTQCTLTKCDHSMRERVDEDKLEENVAKQLIEERMRTERQLLDIDEKYYSRFMEILPAQKVLKLNRLEKKFMREVMSQNSDEGRNCPSKDKSIDKNTKQLRRENSRR